MIEFDAYGYRLGITRREGAWHAVHLGEDGVHRPADWVTVPPWATEDELTAVLSDLMHEAATAERPDAIRLTPVRAARAIEAASAQSMRRTVLRPYQPPKASAYPLDAEPDTMHAGAFAGGELVATGSIFCEPPEGVAAGLEGAESPEPASAPKSWRIRGMATAPDHRGNGYGAGVLRALVEHARSKDGDEVWCNARLEAATFYDRHGFRPRGPEFDLPGLGPHVRMFLPLTPESS